MEHCECGGRLRHYNGALGYEAMRCQVCGEDWGDWNPDDHADHKRRYWDGERNNPQHAAIYCKPGTHPDVANRLLSLLSSRVRIHYGDTKTGRDSMDTYDVEGWVSRTTTKHPILVHNRRSLGGGLIMTDRIVKITSTRSPRQVLYKHPKYHTPAMVLDLVPGYLQERPFMLFIAGDYHSTFETEQQALRYCKQWWDVKPTIQYEEFCNV